MGDPESRSASDKATEQDAGSHRPHELKAQTGKGIFSRMFGALLSQTPPETDVPDRAEGQHLNGASTAGAVLGLLNLRRMALEEVAVPRAEIVAVPAEIDREELVQVFRNSGYTRLPVYEGTLDTPLGMVHLKDFALTHGFNGAGATFNLRQMLRPLIFAPPSMPIGVLLQKMQSQRTHLALVIDEYGGVDGLATIEDLIEQVIGEIEDEHDVEEDQLWTMETPGCYLAQARAPLNEFQDELGLRLVETEDEEEVDTLGGLVFMLTGRVPARGEVIPHPDGPEFEIVDADPRRIKRIRVRVPGAGG